MAHLALFKSALLQLVEVVALSSATNTFRHICIVSIQCCE